MILEAGGATYTVVPVAVTSSPDSPEALGYCNVTARTIELVSAQSIDCAYETLVHEYGHACEAAGIDLYRQDAEKRVQALAAIACSFHKQYKQQGGDDALRKLLGIRTELDEIAEQTPDVPWGTLEGAALYEAVFRYVYCRSLTDLEFATYRAEVEQRRMNPFIGECYPIKDRTNGRVLIGMKMPGLRRLAREYGARVGKYQWRSADRDWSDEWLTDAWGEPAAARVQVITPDGEEFYGIAEWRTYAEYATLDGARVLTGMWPRMGSHLLALAAERLGIGRAIPLMSNVIIDEELQYRPSRRVASRTIEPQRPQLEHHQADPVETEPPASMDELHKRLADMGYTAKISRDAFVMKVRKNPKTATLEDDDPMAFYAAVLGLAQASLR